MLEEMQRMFGPRTIMTFKTVGKRRRIDIVFLDRKDIFLVGDDILPTMEAILSRVGGKSSVFYELHINLQRTKRNTCRFFT